MNRQIAVIGIALACGLAGCRACPCPPVAVAPPARGPAAEAPQVFIEMTCVRVPEAAVADLPAGAASHSTVILDAERRDALLLGWARDQTVEIVHAPRILALADQRASVFVGEDHTQTSGAAAAPPALSFAPDSDPPPAWVGMSILVTPTIASGAVDLDVSGTWGEAKNPDAKDAASLDIRRARVARHLRVTPEQTALVVADGALEREGKSYRMVLLVGARVLATEPPISDGTSADSLRRVALHGLPWSGEHCSIDPRQVPTIFTAYQDRLPAR